jgi:type VI secretion system secreted protein Hcp
MSAVITVKFKNIKGESSVKAAPAGSFDVLSWNWGMSQSASAHVSLGASQGSADVRDLTFTKLVDKASPTIFTHCFGGKNQEEATLSMWKTANGKTYEYLKVAMSGIVFISSHHTGDIGDNDQLHETITLNFSTVKVSFTPSKANGDPDATVDGDSLNIAEKL